MRICKVFLRDVLYVLLRRRRHDLALYREEGKGKKEAVQKQWWEVAIVQAVSVQTRMLWKVEQSSFSFFILTHSCNITQFQITHS